MRFWLAAVLLAVPASVWAQTPNPASGIPLEVADARAARISQLSYDLRLTLPAAASAPITGTMVIRATLKGAPDPLVIDFATSRDHVKQVRVAEKPVETTFVNGHIVVPAAALSQGPNAITIDFVAGDASLNRNPDFLYALFVPARAHLAIPCFDQPNLKAKWNLQLTGPAAWQLVSNGAEIERRPSGDQVTVRFAETAPLPTYLFSFVAGDFKVETAERDGRTFRMFHRETDAAKVARNRDAIFDLHGRALAFLEDYTKAAYAFGKFDFVLIPAFQFGGMEHAGKILYNAAGLLLDESATQNQYLGRASVIAHETAHMWFGDLVTMRWFNDVWMKEVFANFMAAKIVNPSFPEVNHELRFLLSHYPAAYEVDRTPGTNAIRQSLANLNEAGSLYGAIIYQKAPIVMRHLEALMGETVFRDGLRDYLRRYSFGNATWSDLIAILDARTPVDLAQWSRVWVEEAGRPAIQTELEVVDGKIARLAFRQSDPGGRSRVWPQELRLLLGYDDRVQPMTVPFNQANVVVKDAAGLPAPLYILPNGGGWAYGGFAIDQRSLAFLATSLPRLPDPLTRGAAWVTLWDALQDGRIQGDAFLRLAQSAVAQETDEQLTSRILSYAGNAWWRFVPHATRTASATAFERQLRSGLSAARTASQKAAWFSALRNVSLTPETVSWLRRVWNKDEAIPGLPLAEADYTTLALELAVREVDGWREILTTQLDRIENADRKARFQFVLPALSADPSERARWFASLADVNNRRREPWVLEGLNYLHHPLRAADAARFVQPALDLLWDIQKTGDIFFPKRWMDTTLGGHQSPAVARTVRDFLERLPPDYPVRLKNIVLQSADELFRATEGVHP
jgi:aminopeptidase N